MKQKCGDCLHYNACAAWNIGSLANTDAGNCINFEHIHLYDSVEVVRCKDCKHRPYSTEPGKTYGLTIKAPDGRCPCYNEDDGWYSWVPDNEFFCSYGERKEGQR